MRYLHLLLMLCLAGVVRGEAVDPTTLRGKVLTGYQGWFRAEGDGSGMRFHHYEKRGRFEPGACTIDLWPDVSELAADEKFPTAFRHADGSVAHVFSSYRYATVNRHLAWMKQYGIDGVFLQRFMTRHLPGRDSSSWDTVLDHVRRSAAEHGRVWAVMYDLSGLKAGEVKHVLTDWRRLRDELKVTAAPGYLHDGGRPVLAVWGVGFADDRAYTLEECRSLIEALKTDGAGCTLVLGVPSFWREQKRDAVKDAGLHAVLQKADVLCPWTVGRYGDVVGARRHAEEVWQADLAWCRENGKQFLPTVFPGFSWFNLKGGEAKLNAIPRRGGDFLWAQCAAAARLNAGMIYVAMFDEIDEATAIFKCTNDAPVGPSPFVTFEGLPSDHYLFLTGEAGRMIRGEVPVRDELPRR